MSAAEHFKDLCECGRQAMAEELRFEPRGWLGPELDRPSARWNVHRWVCAGCGRWYWAYRSFKPHFEDVIPVNLVAPTPEQLIEMAAEQA